MKLRKALFPGRYRQKPVVREFVTVEDPIAARPMKIFVREDSWIELRVVAKGLYQDWEKESLKIWANLARHSKTIIDIGANTGMYSLVASNNNPGATVIAIEPIDINYSVLTSNIRENSFNIKTEKVALSDTEGTAKMFMIKDKLNYMTSINDNRYEKNPEIAGGDEVVEVDVPMKVFSFIENKHGLGKIDLIKIDVEGHEITVLNSMMDSITKWKPTILIEIIGDDNAKVLNGMFDKLGYKYISIDEKSRSKVVPSLWDNDHHNFLVCTEENIALLREKDLVS
jgi:FkbM family methyltransferase